MKHAAENDEAEMTSKVSQRAFGPAADEFGREIAPLGKEVGAVMTLVGQRLISCVRGAVYGIDQIGDWLREAISKRLKETPPENIVEPNPRIAVPATQALMYSMNDETIREMFANLLASDMTSTKKGQAHPAFVEIIKVMTPTDAKLMGTLTKAPQVKFAVRFGSGQKWREVGTSFSFPFEEKCFGDYMTSLVNLQRLGLIEIRRSEWPDVPDLEAKELALLAKNQIVGDILKKEHGDSSNLGESPSLFLDKSGVFLTALGASFAGICLQFS